MTNHRTDASRGAIVRGLAVALALIAATVALRLLSPALIAPDTARRAFGVLLGVVVIAYANAVPKLLPSLERMRCDPATDQALRRFTGWALAIGGAAYAAAWVIAPVARANLIGAALLGAAVLAVLIRLALAPPRSVRG